MTAHNVFDRLQDFFFGPCLRIIPRLGPITEQTKPPVPSPPHSCCCFPRNLKRYLLMAFTMTDSQQATLTVTFTDKKGNPVTNPPLDGVPQWLTDTPAVLTLTPSADGLSCVIAATGALGDAKVTFTGDADLGAGMTPLIGSLDVTIVSGPATAVTINPGTPTEQPG